MLNTLEIKGTEPDQEPELIPVLKSVVTSRAMAGSPLKSFAFHMFDEFSDPHMKWDLIGREGNFIMKEVPPTNPFLLRIWLESDTGLVSMRDARMEWDVCT